LDGGLARRPRQGENPPQDRPVGRWQSGPVGELRIDYGPGYRVYFQKRGTILILLLCGGDKQTQDKDIRKAKKIWRRIGKE
jgi:putative addiction module killer protein